MLIWFYSQVSLYLTDWSWFRFMHINFYSSCEPCLPSKSASWRSSCSLSSVTFSPILNFRLVSLERIKHTHITQKPISVISRITVKLMKVHTVWMTPFFKWMSSLDLPWQIELIFENKWMHCDFYDASSTLKLSEKHIKVTASQFQFNSQLL